MTIFGMAMTAALRDELREARTTAISDFLARVEGEELDRVAAAIANARGGRRGAPPISNVMDVLPQKLKDEVRDDARAILSELRAIAGPAQGERT